MDTLENYQHTVFQWNLLSLSVEMIMNQRSHNIWLGKFGGQMRIATKTLFDYWMDLHATNKKALPTQYIWLARFLNESLVGTTELWNMWRVSDESFKCGIKRNIWRRHRQNVFSWTVVLNTWLLVAKMWTRGYSTLWSNITEGSIQKPFEHTDLSLSALWPPPTPYAASPLLHISDNVFDTGGDEDTAYPWPSLHGYKSLAIFRCCFFQFMRNWDKKISGKWADTEGHVLVGWFNQRLK